MTLRLGIIGSGASGMFCGAKLSRNSARLNITMFEQGPDLEARCDHVRLNDSCAKCDICTVNNGLGGNALVREMRLSTSPAGSGLISLI